MSSVLSSPTTAASTPTSPVRKPKRTRTALIAVAITLILLVLTAASVYLYQQSASSSRTQVPTVKVARGDVSMTVFAKGELRGGNSQVLTAPMTGGGELHILTMTPNASPVHAGDTIIQFDTSDQEFALREAESDLEEAEEHIKQAVAQRDANIEEDKDAINQAQSALELAQLEARKNPILPAITAKQNDLAIAVARDKLNQLQQDSANKKATDAAGIQMQQAAQGKAEAKIVTAKQNIEAMTVKAQRAGYVAVKQNTNTNFFFTGMELPMFQVGDSVRPGMAVAEIPDLDHWEVAANVGELDRGHLSPGDKVNVRVIALPGQNLPGHITDIGSTSGTPWDRHFECKVALDGQSPNLRPGMSARVEITTETLHNALWLPAQALFQSDGKDFVYLRSGKSFARHDVTLIRRNETRVVLSGVQEGQEVALANPTEEAAKKPKSGASPMEVLSK